MKKGAETKDRRRTRVWVRQTSPPRCAVLASNHQDDKEHRGDDTAFAVGLVSQPMISISSAISSRWKRIRSTSVTPSHPEQVSCSSCWASHEIGTWLTIWRASCHLLARSSRSARLIDGFRRSIHSYFCFIWSSVSCRYPRQ